MDHNAHTDSTLREKLQDAARRGTRPDDDDGTPLVLCGAALSGAHLINADLCGVDLREADLTGANLYRAHLDSAVLRRARLRGAGLNEARLGLADLRGADLRECKLVRADLRGAALAQSTLQRAYLSEAILAGVDLTGADLTEANLSGADLTGADLTGADLSRANLQDIRGRPAARGNTRLSAGTYRQSGWSTAQLIDWLQSGAVLVDPENLPRAEHQHLFAVQLGLTIKFQVHIQPVDWFALYALIARFRQRHPGENLRVVAFSETEQSTTVRVLADNQRVLMDFAETLSSRRWEKPEAFTESALVPLTSRLRCLLSWLVDRIQCLELYIIQDSALRKERDWLVRAEPRGALSRLLWIAFQDRPLRPWLSTLPEPGTLLDAEADLAALTGTLERRGLVNAALFSGLLLEAPAHAEDIREVAALWSVELARAG